ncbi:histone deacetylase complex subunit sap30l [Anaeramoeba ignava]|uniref:Histone deacetylase complex subunit sap30l n=1 Tax=Anaeramoeba ignava TaxID=1746090 RepID=A0A9Q0LR33_ANAIG|nr:histone deacetylase complex subunit sap30l [Anaeramoeba ignava]
MGRSSDKENRKSRRSTRKTTSRYSSGANQQLIDFSKLDRETLHKLKKIYKIKAAKNAKKHDICAKISECFMRQQVDEKTVIRNFLRVVKENN